jgi:glutamate-1-semialdehyde 2,1-aminomutase
MSIGKKVQTGWRLLFDKYGIKVKIEGIYPLSHFSFEYPNHLAIKALFVQEMLKKGFLATNGFYSMYAHGNTHVMYYLEAMDEILPYIAEAIDSGKVEHHLIGKPATAGFKRLT